MTTSPTICALCGGPRSDGVLGCIERPGADSLADLTDRWVLEGDVDVLEDRITSDSRCPDCGALVVEPHHAPCEFSVCSIHNRGRDQCGCDQQWLDQRERASRPAWWRRLPIPVISMHVRLRQRHIPNDGGEIIR